MVLADSIDRSMVDEQFQKHLKIQLADCFLVVFDVLTVSDLILHVLDLLLGRVETHASHHVCYGT